VGGVRFIRSNDGGHTWSPPVQPISTLTGIEQTKPGPWTYVGPSMSIDRTWLAVDSSTGVLYLSSRDLGGIHGHRYITSSRDGRPDPRRSLRGARPRQHRDEGRGARHRRRREDMAAGDHPRRATGQHPQPAVDRVLAHRRARRDVADDLRRQDE